MAEGILEADFTTIPLGDVGVTVSRTPITTTHDPVTGDETLTTGTAVNMTAYIVRKDQGTWTLDKEGKIEGGDAIMVFAQSLTLNKDDIITWQSNDYRVNTVLTRYAGNTTMYKVANLFLRE